MTGPTEESSPAGEPPEEVDAAIAESLRHIDELCRPKPRRKPTAAINEDKLGIAYSDEVSEQICFRIANGEPLDLICDDPSMPYFSIVDGWLQSGSPEHEPFRRGFRAALETSLRKLEWRLKSVSIDARRKNETGAAKLEIETTRALLKAHLPVKWGDRIGAETLDPRFSNRPPLLIVAGTDATPSQRASLEDFNRRMMIDGDSAK